MRAYQCVVKLQSKEPDFIKAWNLICDVSRNGMCEKLITKNVILTKRACANLDRQYVPFRG